MTDETLLLFVFKMQFPTMKINCIKHTRNPVKARSTKHQVHLGTNHATTVLINTLVYIVFAVFKNELEILDNMYSKMQSRPNLLCVSSSQYRWLVCSLQL